MGLSSYSRGRGSIDPHPRLETFGTGPPARSARSYRVSWFVFSKAVATGARAVRSGCRAAIDFALGLNNKSRKDTAKVSPRLNTCG